jgi:hypothetical protein
MTRPPGPNDHILFIIQSNDWKKGDTMLAMVILKNIKFKKINHPKVFEELAFRQEIIMN